MLLQNTVEKCDDDYLFIYRKLEPFNTSQLPSHNCKLLLSSLSFSHAEASHQSPALSLWIFLPAEKKKEKTTDRTRM